MKNLFICLPLAFASFFTFAQAPEGFNYQGVARDNAGKELLSKSIGLRFSILSNTATGTVVYSESHITSTNTFGLFSVKIGEGTKISGNFNGINWSNNKYFLKVEMDPAGGSAYTFMGSSQLISVPFALMANKSQKSLNDLDTSAVNELQILKLSNDTLYLDRGGFVYLGKYDDKNAIQSIKNKLISDSAYLVTKINTERTDRQIFDNSLGVKIKSDSVYLKGLFITNSMSISNEANARIAGDKNLNTKIISDSTYLKGLINTETSNRSNADNNLQTNINNLKAKEASDSSLFAAALSSTITDLTKEINTRISSDNSIKTRLVADSIYQKGLTTTETSSRISADNSIRTKVVADSAYLKGLINNTNLGTEIADRTNADNALQTNITNEINARISAVNNLKSKHVSDSTYLKGLITTEISNRTTADNSIRTKMSSDSSSLRTAINTTNTNLSNNYYTKTNMQTSGSAQLHFDNLTNKPSTLTGYGINDAATSSHTHSAATTTAAGFMSTADKSKLNAITGTNTGDQTLSISNDTVRLTNGGFVKIPTGVNGTSAGNIQYWNGTAWVVVPPGQPGQLLQYTAGNKPVWSGATYPTVTTSALSALVVNNLTAGGNVTSDGGGTISARGVCWSTNRNPTTANSKTVDGTGTGAFTSYVTNLSANTKFYIRAYATNSAGTSYGSIDSCTTGNFVTDIENNGYDTIRIGSQTWMKQNLKTTKYSDGTVIPLVTAAGTWPGLATGARCYYLNDSTSFKDIYGALYNWYAVNTAKLCPTGWHVPSDAEWTTLENYVGGLTVAGGYLKEAGNSHWSIPNTGATNSYGFTGLPAGDRSGVSGAFEYISLYGQWWTSTAYNTSNGYYRNFVYNSIASSRTSTAKSVGFSVRCLKN